MPTLNDAPIAVVGLGYVGLPLAVEFGKKRKVVGFDINTARIAELRSVPPSSSPSLRQSMSTSVPISPPYSKHRRRSEGF